MSRGDQHESTGPLRRDWHVLLVGGASGVGKTTVARQLAKRFDVSLSQVDGYRLMLERSTSPETMPALHRYARRDAADAMDGAALCAAWIDVAQEVSHALEIVIAFHAATEAAAVVEGDTLLPFLGSSRVLAGIPVFGRVRSVFLHEPDEARLEERLMARDRGYQLMRECARRRELERTIAYGRWLAAEAHRHGCPVIIARDCADETTAAVVELLTSSGRASQPSSRVAEGASRRRRPSGVTDRPADEAH